MNIIKLGWMLQNSPRPAGSIGLSVGSAIKNMALSRMREIAGMTHRPPKELKSLAGELEKFRITRAETEKILKMDYFVLSSIISSSTREHFYRTNSFVE